MFTGMRTVHRPGRPHLPPQSSGSTQPTAQLTGAGGDHIVVGPPHTTQQPSVPTQRKRSVPTPADGDSNRRPRRDRGPNWNMQEMLALVAAKRDEYMGEVDTVDARDLMEPDVTKWSRISAKLIAARYSPCTRDHSMCKSKWHLIIADYRRIADYHARTGINKQVYWSQTSGQHVQDGLPKCFA